ncbi:MAG: DUF916 domain-containing protein [Chloroflexales bacterium]|nr:DUF916 domain-containing protein [Chloroflexales bacterium]
MNRLLLGLLTMMTLSILLTLASPAPARAEGGANFSLRPVHYDPARPATQSYFILDFQAGENLRSEMRVVNTGQAAGTVRLYPIDAATGQNSGAIYEGRESTPRDTGAWLTLDTNELTLGPGEERLVGFSVNVPADARPGEHLGGIAAEGQAAPPTDSGAAVQITMQTRTVVAVLVNIPGPRVDKVVIEGIQPETQGSYQMLRIGLRNEGTHMARLVGSLDLSDSTGRPLAQIPLKLDYLLPGTAISYPLAIPNQALAAGDYRADLKLSYGEGETTTLAAPLVITSEQIRELYTARGQQLPDLPTAPAQSAQTQGAQPLIPPLLFTISAVLFAAYLLRRRRAKGM